MLLVGQFTDLEKRVRDLVAVRKCAESPGRAQVRVARGFTLIDVLVSLAVVVVLVSLFMPSLGRVRETAHQVICRSNVRQIGIGISMYAEDHTGRLMGSVNAGEDGTSSMPWDTVALRLAPSIPGLPGSWDGLGLLYGDDYLLAPKLYYCPSHHGQNAFRDYEDEWSGRANGRIYGNFQFRGGGPVAARRPGRPLPPNKIFLSHIHTGAAIVADSMRTLQDFNHKIGANVLRADNSVDWFSDNGGRVAMLLPREGQQPPPGQFEDVWRNLDDDGR
jgi:competence protein ComGC